MTEDRKFFYVIGGTYTDEEFSDLRAGTSVMDGPFHTREEATDAWRKRSQGSTANVLERYDIVELLHTIPRSVLMSMSGAK